MLNMSLLDYSFTGLFTCSTLSKPLNVRLNKVQRTRKQIMFRKSATY